MRALTIGTGQLREGVHPKHLMLGRGYVPLQFLAPMEHTWAHAESAAGQTLSASLTLEQRFQMILEDDQVSIAQGGQAIRRLMLVHLVRSMEWIAACRQAVEVNAIEMANEPAAIWARSQLSIAAGGLLLPEAVTRQRVHRETRDYLLHAVAEWLPNWYAQSLGSLDGHRLCLVRAPHGRGFVLSDAPAFTVRIAEGQPRVGLGAQAAPLSRESEIFMPLGPTMCALLTCDTHQSCANNALIDWVNDVQSDRAMQTIVCSLETPLDVVDRVVQRIVGRWGHDVNGVPLGPPAGEDVPAVRLVNV
ncbi:hypothetical protein [Candidatus Poriferisodalis sp.]|uniref:hypothetical protein n=1 Tax=Candidatus Poriferisodalis sp. TaxID=3101277 RepID=UPI003B59E18F